MNRAPIQLNFPIYDYLESQVESGKYSINIRELAITTNALIRKVTGQVTLSEMIYVIMVHYSLKHNITSRNAALGGTMMGKASGITYNVANLPIGLVQMLHVMITEINSNTFPFQIQQQ